MLPGLVSAQDDTPRTIYADGAPMIRATRRSRRRDAVVARTRVGRRQAMDDQRRAEGTAHSGGPPTASVPGSRAAPRETAFEPDPVVEAYKRHVDRTLLRQNLRRSVTERVANLIALQRLAAEARRAGRARERDR